MKLENCLYFSLLGLAINLFLGCVENKNQHKLTAEENIYNGIVYRLTWTTEREGREKATIDTHNDLDSLESKYNLDEKLTFRVDSLRKAIEPELKRILRKRQPEKDIYVNTQKERGDSLGRWLEVVPNMPEYNHTIVIRKIDDEYVMETYHKDGSSGSSKLIEYFVAGERRFKEYGNTYDEYYVVDSSGGLRMYDREGYIKTAPPVQD